MFHASQKNWKHVSPKLRIQVPSGARWYFSIPKKKQIDGSWTSLVIPHLTTPPPLYPRQNAFTEINPLQNTLFENVNFRT